MRDAVARGLAPSAEEFVSQALRSQKEDASYEAELENWLRDEVVPAHEEFMKDPSTGVPASEVLNTIKARRQAEG